MSSELIRIWVAGWADSRHAPRPIELPWDLYAEVPAQPGGRAGEPSCTTGSQRSLDTRGSHLQ